MNITNISAGPSNDGDSISVSLDLIFEGLSVSEAILQVMNRLSGGVEVYYPAALPEFAKAADIFTAGNEALAEIAKEDPIQPSTAADDALNAKVEQTEQPAPSRRSRRSRTRSAEPAAQEPQTSAPSSAETGSEPATSSRRRSRTTETVHIAEAIHNIPKDDPETPAPTIEGDPVVDTTPAISSEQAEDRISDADLIKACSLAAAKITADGVRLIMRGIAGGLKEGQSVHEIPAANRRGFLDALDAEVAKMDPSAFTA